MKIIGNNKKIGVISTVTIIASYILLLMSGNSSVRVMLQNIFVIRSRVQILSVLILVLTFILLISLTKSYWLTMMIYLSATIIIAIANHEKYSLRNEGILPSDLLMLKSMGKILEMISPLVIIGTFLSIILLAFACYYCFKNVKIHMSIYIRIFGVLIPLLGLGGLVNIQKQGTIAYKVGQLLGDNPIYYDSAEAVESNGPVVNFVNNLNVESMSKPDNYSQKKMSEITEKYAKYAAKLNQTRKENNSTVIYVLSESFSDPLNVPGIKLSSDPIPYTRSLMKNTESGTMISDGYGGGTANMEYQALTGLSMGNFSATLPTPYTQLVPSQKKVYSVNNLFSKSYAIHPYSGTLYSREEVFNKMKFNDFYYLHHGFTQSYAKRIGNNPYTSDKATYKFLLDRLAKSPNKSFYQVSTMQNHMPYDEDYYKGNKFKVTGNISSDEKQQIETYVQGLKYTDEANRYLIKQLSKMKQNISVVFYGDHLPGIYTHLNFQKYGVKAHETPYFIWSNHKKYKQSTTNVMGTYGFTSKLFDEENSKLTPYLALLHKVNTELPVIASKVSSKSSDPNLPNGGMNLIDQSNLSLIDVTKLSKSQKQLLNEYQLVQYNITAGKYYYSNELFSSSN